MPSIYLLPSEYALYGVSGANPQMVAQACSLIDTFLSRPEGLVWTADGNGNPCYMTAMQPSITMKTLSAISPGQNVQVQVMGPMMNTYFFGGTSVVLDRSNPTSTESCQIVSISGNTITLDNVSFSHDFACTLEFGMFIQEDRAMPFGRPVTVLSRNPVVRLLAGQGQYGYARRGSMDYSAINHFNLLAAVTQFGGPPTWEKFDVTHAGLDMSTGQVWVPAGVLLAYYTNVRIQYIAGWTYVTLPSPIKQACANIINSMINFPEITGNIKLGKAGDGTVQRFTDSVLDSDTKRLLEPFKLRGFV